MNFFKEKRGKEGGGGGGPPEIFLKFAENNKPFLMLEVAFSL